MKDCNEVNQGGEKQSRMTRRKLLGALGLAGATLATSGLLNNRVYGQTVSEAVYSTNSSSFVATSSSNGVFNVLDYRVAGQDDTEAIQDAINAAASVNGTVYFPPGN